MRSNYEVEFSVIIPYFNDMDTIESCLQSVTNQVYPPAEVFVIDDHSEDFRFIQDLCHKYEVRLIRNESNMGSGNSRNLGILAASKKFVALLDADDMWDCRHLEIHSKLWKMAGGKVSVIGTKMRVIKSQNSHFFDNNLSSSEVELELRYLRPSDVAVKNPFFNSATSIFLSNPSKTTYYSAINPTYCEDYGLLYSFLRDGYQIGLSNAVTGTYLHRENSKSSKFQEVFSSRISVSLALITLDNVDSKLIRLKSWFVAYLVFLSSIKSQLNSGQDFSELSHVYFRGKFTFRLFLIAFRSRILWSILLSLNRFIGQKFMLRVMHRRNQFRNSL